MKAKQASIAFIFVTVMLDMVGLGLVIPSLPDVMRHFASGEADVTRYFGYFISLYALMQFLASPLLGAVSDLVGRRPVLLVSLCTAALDYLFMAFAPTLPLLFLGRLISGLTGANATVAMAYVADISDDENRSANFGKMSAAFGLGFIIGPVLGGFVSRYGASAPFLLAALMNAINFLFGLFVLPESLRSISEGSPRKKITWKRVDPFTTMLGIFRIPGVFVLAVVYFLQSLAANTHMSIWTLYTESRFAWTSTEVGFSLAVVGICSAISQGWLTGKIVPKLGELRTVRWGMAGYVLAYLACGLASTGWMMYSVLIVSSVVWVAGPALQALLTGCTPPESQGELQGSLVSLQSLAAILNPLLTTQLFARFGTRGGDIYIPGAPYFFSALVCLIALPLVMSGKFKDPAH